jgi:hypothetical protein
VKVLAEQNQDVSWWPQKGDTLLASGIDWESEALVDVSSDSFLAYAFGYKTAADCVVASVEARRVAADRAVYPVCFLYRHYLELMLKGLIRLGNQLQDASADYPKDEHDLRKLWRECRVPLEDAGRLGNGSPADVEAVEKCILELAALDPTSQAFRYGEDKGGKPSFKKRTQFSLTNMQDVMRRLSGFLEGSYDWMDELLQFQADVDSESR